MKKKTNQYKNETIQKQEQQINKKDQSMVRRKLGFNSGVINELKYGVKMYKLFYGCVVLIMR